MWNLDYSTRGAYLEALEQALADKDIPDAQDMINDIKNYFFKCNLKAVGDSEVIAMLPDPQTLAAQYDGKVYGSPRDLKKKGSAGVFKRFGIFLLTVLAVALGVTFYVLFLGLLLAGIASVALAVLNQLQLIEMLPAIVQEYFAILPLEDMLLGTIFLASFGIFWILLSGTALKALRRLRKKYHTWTLKKISGCFRLPVSLDDVYSKAWRVFVYIFLPLSMIAAFVSAGAIIFGFSFTF